MLEKKPIVRKPLLYKIGFIIAAATFVLLLSLTYGEYTNVTGRKFIPTQILFEQNDSSSIPKSEAMSFKYIAAIVEFRSTPVLMVIVLNVIQHIPENWPIQIFHGKSNAEFIKKSRLSTYIESGKIILTNLNDHEGGYYEFTSVLFTNISFWKQVRGEKVLFFQVDSAMCSNSSHKITDYLQYDYIGAPWAGREPRVGNGGFSFRSKNKTLILLEKARNSVLRYARDHNEDVWYSIYMSSVGSVPSVDVAKTFAVESIYYPNPLAVHKMGIVNPELRKLCEACPEARLVPPYCT